MNKCTILLLVWLLNANACSTRPGKGSAGTAVLPPTTTLSTGNGIDTDFLAFLSSTGVLKAAGQIGLEIDKYIKPLAQRVDHNYRRYRWSVGHHEGGGIMISAFPPEEESGWTPWEIWYKDDQGITRKESLVLFPLKDPTSAGVAHWYKLDEDGLMPRYLNTPANLKEQLHRARIYDAARVLGFDTEEVLIAPLSEKAKSYYQQCRWVVIPHILGGDGPVIYILPPMDHSDVCPWESWYSDGKVKLIHHVHYTEENKLTKGYWNEYAGAPQRPPEIFGVVWYWYDDLQLMPAMADIK